MLHLELQKYTFRLQRFISVISILASRFTKWHVGLQVIINKHAIQLLSLVENMKIKLKCKKVEKKVDFFLHYFLRF